MQFITQSEFTNTRLCELPNNYYNALEENFAKRVGGYIIAHEVLRKNAKKTLREFDNNSFLSVLEVFKIL